VNTMNPYLNIAPKPVRSGKRQKEIRRPGAEAAPRTCWLCGRNGCGDPLDKHHIFGGAFRRKSEQYGATVYLCHNRCHESGEQAVHRSADTMLALHQWGQQTLMEENGWTEEDFVREFGRNYI
jgi:hypothetical protein